jgi:hypothetical protein
MPVIGLVPVCFSSTGLLGLTGAATHPHHHRSSDSDDPPAHWTGDKNISANGNGQRDDGQSSGTISRITATSAVIIEEC